MNVLSQKLKLGGSIAAFLSVATFSTAQAQAQAQDAGQDIEQVVVTGSRVDRAGFVAPTPTTVLAASDLLVGGATNLGTALASIPSYAPVNSAATTRGNNNAGQDTANLRDLGVQRTLVLIDGARPVTTSPGNNVFGFDLNMIPSVLIKTVEVVTGGASAQWGSDAVAGVMNIEMNNDFSGFKAQVQDGSDTEGLGSNEYKAEMAYGTTFDGNRGHVVLGGGFDQVHGVYPAYETPTGNAGIIPNPNYTSTNGQPQGLFVTNVLNNDASIGGLITSGPLKGTNFGPGGSIGTFQYGQYGQLASSGTLMVGGDPSARLYTIGNSLSSGPAIAPLIRENFYGAASYELNSDTTLTADVLAGRVANNQIFSTDDNLGNITIANTNAYLPAQIVSAMAANKVTSFTLGRDNTDFGPIMNYRTDKTVNVKIGAKGNLGGVWSWDAFYSYGQSERVDNVANQPITANFANSVNAVASPTTGQPVCAIALANPSTNCVPVNLFGPGSASPAALAYFEGQSVQTTYLYQHELAANLRGEPFSLWAGPVSFATGLEYRYEGDTGSTDAVTATGAFTFDNNYALRNGHYTVAEGYMETVVPLVKDAPLLQELDLNGAFRVSGYSTSGVIPSWKVGLVDNVTSDLLLRGTVSRDIRAPNLQELNTLQQTGITNVTNPANNTSYPVSNYTGGNPSLKAETADTWTVGATYQPSWLANFNVALDYYNIAVKNAVATLTAQVIVNQCYSGQIAAACAEITTVNGAPTAIHSTYINIADYNASGVDLDLGYNSDLSDMGLAGQFSARWLTNYINTLQETQGTTLIPLAGSVYNGGGANLGMPRWRSTFTVGYALDEVSLSLRARYVGGGAYELTETINAPVKPSTYFDLGAVWHLPVEPDIALYGDVDNLFDTINIEGASASPGLFDNIGRIYDVGLRVAL